MSVGSLLLYLIGFVSGLLVCDFRQGPGGILKYNCVILGVSGCAYRASLWLNICGLTGNNNDNNLD
jgi:hypothetical protein